MITDETIKKIIELKKQGYPNKIIAKALKIDVKTVRKYLPDISNNTDLYQPPSSSTLTNKRTTLYETKLDTDILKAQIEHQRQKQLTGLQQMESALQEDSNTQKEKEIQFKYGMLYINQWLEESGTPEIFDNNQIEEIKSTVIQNLKQCFLDASFDCKETLEDCIRQDIERTSNNINTQDLKRWEEEEKQRKIKRFQEKQHLYTLRRLGTLQKKGKF